MIPAAQWQAALTLAEEHGHDWAAWALGGFARALAIEKETERLEEEAERLERLEVASPESWEARREASYARYLERQKMVEEFSRSVVAVPLAEIPASWEEARHAFFEAASLFTRRQVGIGPSWRHTTSSGRLSWDVDGDGMVHFTVARPTGVVIRCMATSRGKVTALTTHGVYGERHIDSLGTALWALAGKNWGGLPPTLQLRTMPGYDDVLEVRGS